MSVCANALTDAGSFITVRRCSQPKRLHEDLQRRIRKLLEQVCEPLSYIVDAAYPYKALPEHELWGADVAVVSEMRAASIADWLDGSPELVVEVKSPSNAKSELHDKAMTALNGGMHVYAVEQALPLPYFGGVRLSLSSIFE